MERYWEIVKMLAKYLNDNNIPYMLVGAISVAAWGNPRASRDVDLMFILGDKIVDFADFLKKNGFSVDAEDIEAALKEKSHFTIFDDASDYVIDAKGLYSDFDRESFNRRRKADILGHEVWVSPPEDTILIKLQFGSDQDMRDARSILERQAGKLDESYLNRKINEFGLQKQFEKIKVE